MLDFLRVFASALRPTSLQTFEWHVKTVRKKRLANDPDWLALTTPRADLHFNGWQLAHAIVKADFLDHRSPMLPGLGFLLQSHGLLDFSSTGFSLLPGAADRLGDVAQSSLTGRVGQGVAILFAQQSGYAFTSHLHSLLIDRGISTKDATGKEVPVADFACEDSLGQIVIIESKAAFTQPKNDPTAIKTVLKRALERQVDPWMAKIIPAPAKGYVVYTCIRETGGSEPSSVAFVDPPGPNAPNRDAFLPPLEVRRQNYAAWLTAMSLPDAALRLRRERADGQPRAVDFLIIDIDGTEFAMRRHPFCDPVIALDLKALRAVSALAAGDESKLSNYLFDGPRTARHLDPGQPTQSFSVFPDGSLLGMPRLKKTRVESILV